MMVPMRPLGGGLLLMENMVDENGEEKSLIISI